ncbi:MAG TPA: serine/threonine-protein kinase [Ktedonobacteraceae bacterium]|nr:serine/threonine-protein kinase [Ktedonobacteraceae bacterium]
MEETQFCAHCGAANRIDQELCFACQQPLDADEPEPSLLLLGRYRLTEQIGSGGFGAVYKALDTEANDALVAIKQINLKGLSPQEVIEATSAFNREVELLSTLSHPQLPRIYDQFSGQEHWYVVMDYIEGKTLEAYLQDREARHKPLTVIEALDITLQICNVLRYLHTRQPPVIFRDLKPDNVMRTPQGLLYLIDFGIARHFKPGKKHDTIPLGSPGYAAPEQYGRAQTTPQADIYSLGALLHRMLSQIEPSEQPLTFIPLNLPGVEVNNALNTLLRRMQALVSTDRPESIRAVEYDLRHIKQLQIEAEGARIWSPSQPVLPPLSRPGQPPLYIPPHARQQMQFQQQQQPARMSRRRMLVAGAIVISGLAITTNSLSTMFGRRKKRPFPDFDQPTPDPDAQGFTHWSNTLQLVAFAYPNARTVEIHEPNNAQNTLSSFQVEGLGLALDLYWSADDQRLLTVADKKFLEIWTAPDGQRVTSYVLPEHYDASAAAWSVDKASISTGGQGNLFIWPTSGFASGPKQKALSNSLNINLLSWSSDNQHLALTDNVTDDNNNWTIEIWDTINNKHVNEIKKPYTAFTSSSINSALLWSPASDWIAYATGDTLWILDPANTSASYMLKQGTLDSDFVGMAWSPDGTRLAVDINPTIEIWHVDAQQLLQTFTESKASAVAVGWSLDGTTIATGDASGNATSWSIDQ